MSVDTKRSTFHAPDHAQVGSDMLLYTCIVSRSMQSPYFFPDMLPYTCIVSRSMQSPYFLSYLELVSCLLSVCSVSVIGYRRSMEEESLVKPIIIMPRINVFNKCDVFSVSLKACTSICGISMLNCTS